MKHIVSCFNLVRRRVYHHQKSKIRRKQIMFRNKIYLTNSLQKISTLPETGNLRNGNSIQTGVDCSCFSDGEGSIHQDVRDLKSNGGEQQRTGEGCLLTYVVKQRDTTAWCGLGGEDRCRSSDCQAPNGGVQGCAHTWVRGWKKSIFPVGSYLIWEGVLHGHLCGLIAGVGVEGSARRRVSRRMPPMTDWLIFFSCDFMCRFLMSQIICNPYSQILSDLCFVYPFISHRKLSSLSHSTTTHFQHLIPFGVKLHFP